MTGERIQKVLANAGVASRRAIEEMILEGRITVNGNLVVALPCFVDITKDDIRVDGRRIARKTPQKMYYLLNKPRGVVCTQRDPQGRRRAVELVPPEGRVYCVGRLDVDSTGLVLLTNDGELTQHLTHPKYEVDRTYIVEVDGTLEEEVYTSLRNGVYLDGRKTRGAKVKVITANNRETILEVRVAEGPNREIRRILARLGHKVRRLKRTAIGPISDKGLKIGHYRELAPNEVSLLRRTGKREKE
jgi:23S rRNA pseudouridine2605 synthase